MSHPKTPPDCDLFGKYADGTEFFRFTIGGNQHKYPLNMPFPSAISMFCAAIAFMRWTIKGREHREKYDATFNKYMTGAPLTDDERKGMADTWNAYQECERHAADWMKYGGKK